jgi:HD-GYP domain-containing protein (c-di-GMP phosphodiesterase class II)
VKKRWLAIAANINKELLLILLIIASAGVVNLFVSGQRLVLTFYNLPTLFAAYYFGRRRAVMAAIASILFVLWVNTVNPSVLGASIDMRGMLSVDLAIWAGFLVIFAYAAGTLYEHAEHRLHELRETYYGLLQILSQIISNDKYTQNHSYRVSVYAVQIAQEAGLSESQIEDLRAAALLHDVGKLEVSREVLHKAARLSEDEVKEMRTHVGRGMDMLGPVRGSLRRVLPIILAHHDKFDGSGYHPTQGDNIPIEARIISVADVYDSLISDRPYRKAMSPFDAKEIIVKGSAVDFDPVVVDAFLAAFRFCEMDVRSEVA